MLIPYRGIQKHKNWRPGGGYGTICPTWTHQTDDGGYTGDPHAHPWNQTVAQGMLDTSVVDTDGRRYAARRGIAFEAKRSNDGTWHGYPLPWDEVPADIQDRLIVAGQAKRRDIRKQGSVDRGDLRWALSTDDE
jgi:hypothetical protein